MGPNQNINMSGTGATSAAPVQNTSAAPSENIMTQGVSEKKKGSKGMLYGMILCAVLAVGGIGFGVWTWMDGNTQKDSLNQQISELKKQNSGLQDQILELQETIESYEGGTIINGVEIDDVELPEWGTAKAEVVTGLFSVKNADGVVVAKDESVYVTEVVACDDGTAASPSPLICTVMTSDGQGKFIYNYEDGSLNFVKITE